MSDTSARPNDGWAWVTDALREPSQQVLAAYAPVKNRAHSARVTAFHEACHATCHLLLGSELEYVTIEPNKTAGRITGGQTVPVDDNDKQKALKTSLAGIFGIVLAEPDDNVAPAVSADAGQAFRYLFSEWGKPMGLAQGVLDLKLDADGEAGSRIHAQWAQVCDMLSDPGQFCKIIAVADALLERMRLNGDEAKAIVAAASPLPQAIVDALPATTSAVRVIGSRLLDEYRDDHVSKDGTRLLRA